VSARWDLIHLLARVDGNDRSGAAADTNILDHLYGKQADAILEAGWVSPAATHDRLRNTPCFECGHS
jgi:hypothetical protein